MNVAVSNLSGDPAPDDWLADFDFRNPDYGPVFRRRIEVLHHLRAKPERWDALRAHYRNEPWQAIVDWGMTFDPRNVERGLPALVPFVLFPKQIEFCQWAVRLWRTSLNGASPKSRESGVSWLMVALSVTLCTVYDGMAIGFTSYKQDYVDLKGSPKSIFWKTRKYVECLPEELRAGCRLPRDSPFMNMVFPNTGSVISGDIGSEPGRGDRAAIFWVDEAAKLQDPVAVEFALSQTTRCRIDISTPNGPTGPFRDKCVAGPPVGMPIAQVMRISWRDDPRKDDAWYKAECERLRDPAVIAQELDIDFSASVRGILIPSAWVVAAVDAARHLGIEITGERRAGFDPGDEGDDCGWVTGRGIEIDGADLWSGAGSDIFRSTEHAFELCDGFLCQRMRVDADGLGAGVKGDSRVINERREEQRGPYARINVEPYHGSGAVIDPDQDTILEGKINKDAFGNAKAQAWWLVRDAFRATYQCVVQGEPVTDPEALISLSPTMPFLQQLMAELSQPIYTHTPSGKKIVDKAPSGSRSPNLADALVVMRAPWKPEFEIAVGTAQAFREATSSAVGQRNRMAGGGGDSLAGQSVAGQYLAAMGRRGIRR